MIVSSERYPPPDKNLLATKPHGYFLFEEDLLHARCNQCNLRLLIPVEV